MKYQPARRQDLKSRDFPLPVRLVLRHGRRLFFPWLGEGLWWYPAVAGAFHPPRRNNFVHVFVPRSRDADRVFNTLHVASEPLNDLDGRLLESLNALFERRRDLMTMEVLVSLKAWEKLRKERSYLGSVVELEFIARVVAERAGASLVDVLGAEAPDLFDGFCKLPDEFVRVRRLNLYLTAREARRVFPQLAREMKKFSRVVSHVDVSAVSFWEKETRSFPTLSLYLDPHAPAAVERELVDFLTEQTRSFDLPAPSVEFAEIIALGITLTEGYRLYKRYLNVLGLLDRVYPLETGARRARA